EQPDEHRILRVQPGVRLLEWRRHLLPRHGAGAARARPPGHLLRTGRFRAAAAPRHPGSAVGPGGGVFGRFRGGGSANRRTGAGRRPGGQG
ncbi:MAG: Spore_germination_protein_CgeB, partial [uncultured Ramlibacter sp.]